MPLSGTVNANKDLAEGYQSLLLCAFYPQGTSTPLLLATHSLDGTSGPVFPGLGIMPAGNYDGRIAQQTIAALQHRSQYGIDRITSVSIQIMDADHTIYNSICNVYGFRGATVRMALVLWETGTSNFSSNAPLMFQGIADMERPTKGQTIIEVNANTSHNTAVVKLPNFPLQNRCPLHFPATDAEQAMSWDVANSRLNPANRFCIYSKAVGGLGNLGTPNQTNAYGRVVADGGGVFRECDFTRAACMQRLGNSAGTGVAPDGDIGHDQAGHWTGGFAGIQWSPGAYYTTPKNYVSNSRIAAFSFLNSAILGQYANLVYGQQFINAKIATIVESGNDTKMEAILYDGEHNIGYNPFPVVNGVEVNRFGQGSIDPSLGWDWANDGTNISLGGRRGTPLRAQGYNNSGHTALGDPFGSLCRMGIVVYKDLFTGFGLPTVQVRTIGPNLAVFTSQTAFTMLGYPYNANPVWVTLDIFSRANFQYSEINIQTFVDLASSVCGYGAGLDRPVDKFGAQVTYIDNIGHSNTHARYQCQFSLESRKTAAELLAGVLRSFNGYTYYDQSGLLCLGINQTLADQQPSIVDGSNYTVSVPSVNAAGVSTPGFPAYLFDESNMDLRSIEFEQNATVTTPNRIQINFQDADNSFVADSLNEVDPHSVDRAGGSLNPGGAVIDESLNVEGISNFDQAIRIANVYIAERQYGNEANDARGTRIISFGTTVRCSSLRTGHIVIITNQAYGWDKRKFRILKIAPDTNFQNARVTAQWHDDDWYTDAYGQNPEAFYSNGGASRNAGPPKTWQPFAEIPNVPAGEAYPQLTTTELGFQLAEIDGLDAHGDPIVQLQISGFLPINHINAETQPPRVPTVASLGTGGSIPAGKIVYLKLCSIDTNGNYSIASQTVVSPITTGSNTIVVSNIGWPVGAVNYEIFAGFDSFSLTSQQAGPISTNVTLLAMPNVLKYGPPDINADSIFAQAKLVIHGGIIGSNVGTVTSTTIEIGGPASGTFSNSLAGYKLFLIGRQSLAGANLPIIEFNISSYTLSGGNPVLVVDRNPSSLIHTQDVVVIGARANIAAADGSTIGDVNFVSAYSPFGVSPDGSAQPDVGQVVRIIYGKGRYQYRTIASVQASTGGTNWDTYVVSKPFDEVPDSTSIFIVEQSDWPVQTSTSQFNSNNISQSVVAKADVTNYRKEVVLIQTIIEDSGGTVSVDRRAPLRMIYLTGAQGTKTITFADSPYTVKVVDGLVLVDTSGGQVTVQLPTYLDLQNVLLTIQKVTGDGNAVVVNAASGEAFDDGSISVSLTSEGESLTVKVHGT